MGRFKVKLYFVKGRDTDDVEEVEITTTKERVNDDVGIVMQAMEERGYKCFRGLLEKECDEHGS